MKYLPLITVVLAWLIGIGSLLAVPEIILGAPANFVSTPATTTASSFSFTIGTSTPRGQFGSSTLAVYGSTTIQTPVDTLHAFEIFNAASTSIFRIDSTGNGTASTSALVVSGVNGSTQCLQVNSAGTVSGFGSGCGGTGAAFAWTPNATGFFNQLANSTSTQIHFGASGYSLSASSTSAFDSFNALYGTTTNASTTNFTSDNATSTNLNVTGNFRVTPLTSALTLTDSGGAFAEYAGTSCTNQFVRSLSALGAATCATVGSADVSLANLTATDATLTFSGTYNGSTARTIGINLANANTWSALQTITHASTTNLTVGTFFQVPTASSFGNFMNGSLSFDTTSNNLVIGTTTSPSSAHVVIGSATTTLYSFAIASTSPEFRSGGILNLPAYYLPQVVTAIICDADAGTSVVINLSNEAGSSDTNSVTCTTTSTQFLINTNASFAAYAVPRVEFGTVTGAVDYLSIRIIGYRTSD